MSAPVSKRGTRQVWGPPALVVGGGLVALVVAAALVSFVWTPYDAVRVDPTTRIAPPSAAHWLGTDTFGRDVASQLLVGAVVVERVFVIPGLGSLLLDGVANRDLLLVQGVVIVLVLAVLVVNFLVDVAYTVLDPRLRSAA